MSSHGTAGVTMDATMGARTGVTRGLSCCAPCRAVRVRFQKTGRHLRDRFAERRVAGKYDLIARKHLNRTLVVWHNTENGHFKHLLDALHPEIRGGSV